MKVECKSKSCEANINGLCNRKIVTINVDKTCQGFRVDR